MSSIKEKKIEGNANYINLNKLKDHLEILEKCVCKIKTDDGHSQGSFVN